MITLNTIIYEGNFKNVLKEDSWFFKFENHFISKKLITVNNVTSLDRIETLIFNLKKKFSFDVVLVKDFEQNALDFFKLKMDKNQSGYYYMIPYFVSLLNINTPFIFNVSEDCSYDINLNDEFFLKSIEVLTQYDKYVVTTIPWEKRWDEIGVPKNIPINFKCVGEWEEFNIINKETFTRLEDFWLSDVFSDQVFIGDVDKLKKINYNCKKMGVYKGPPYGDGSFEERLSNFLVNFNTHRLIYKHHNLYYKHGI